MKARNPRRKTRPAPAEAAEAEAEAAVEPTDEAIDLRPPHEDFARETGEDAPELASEDDDLLEQGLRILEPPDEKRRQRFEGGGHRGGEPLRLSEEEDDFEDGRSSGGLYSRAENDEWGRGEESSLAGGSRQGVMSVDEGEPDTALEAEPPSETKASPGTGPFVDETLRRPKAGRGRRSWASGPRKRSIRRSKSRSSGSRTSKPRPGSRRRSRPTPS